MHVHVKTGQKNKSTSVIKLHHHASHSWQYVNHACHAVHIHRLLHSFSLCSSTHVYQILVHQGKVIRIDKMVKGEDMVELEYVIRSVYTKQQYIAKQPECMFHCYGTGSTRWKWLCTCMCMLKRDNKKRKKKSAGVIKFHTIMMAFMTVSHACHVCISINYLSVNYFTASHCALQHTFIKY